MPIQNISKLDTLLQPHTLGAPVVTASSNATIPTELSLEPQQNTVKQIAEQQPTSVQMQNTVNGVNKMLKQNGQNLEFRVDAETNKLVIKLFDKETGDMIRKIPSDEMLAIARSIDRFQQGLLVKQEV